VWVTWVYVDILFIRGYQSYAGLASKKGIAITATIAAAIVGSSFLIWLIPQSSPGSMVELPRDDDEILSDVYSRHQSLATNIQSKFDQWKSGEVVTTSDMLSQISLDRSDIQNMRQQLDSASPAQEWQQSYGFYIQALDSFLKYLDRMQTTIEKNDGMLDSTVKLDGLKQEWEGYVDDSINAMPI
jgi:hypothetical protein